MSIKNKLKTQAAVVLTSEDLHGARQRIAEVRRRLSGEPHTVQYFHDVADPYCHLSLQLLLKLQNKFDVQIEPHLISRPASDIQPLPTEYWQNSWADTVRWARRLGFAAPQQPAPSDTGFAQAEQRLAALLGDQDFASKALQISTALWSGLDIPEGAHSDPNVARRAGDQALAAAGHYLGGSFAYGGECYWGPDRLGYLDGRLATLGLGPSHPPIVPDYSEPFPDATGQELEFFFSFRSPYSYLAFDRVRDLATRTNARLILRPVLPMLMRGLPVPKAKSSYILGDCAREARRLAIPFGRISDPLGAGIERGYALLDYAEAEGRLPEYCAAFMTGAWAQGLDASTDTGLAEVVRQAGLEWQTAKTLIGTSDWRARVEANQERLLQIGLWGVPSFHLNGQSVWGQDRLWVLQDLMRAQA